MNNDNTRARIAYIVMAAALFIIFALFFLAIPPENKDVLNFTLGNFFGIALAITGFYFGTSDKKKDEDK